MNTTDKKRLYKDIMGDQAKQAKKHINDSYDSNEFQFSIDEINPCLLKMAEIGKFRAKKANFILYIWSRDDGYIPHIHIGDADTYPKCEKFQCCLKLEVPEYFPHSGKYSDTFNVPQLDSLIEFLHSNDEDGDPVWKYILKTWNKNNSNVKIPLDTPIPDYSVLK